MFIAMNRFKVKPEAGEEFEAVWRGRESYLDGVPGFVSFSLLKGPDSDGHVLYASHTHWHSKEHFEAWTRSEAFRAAHRNAGDNKHLYLEPPALEMFDAVIKG